MPEQEKGACDWMTLTQLAIYYAAECAQLLRGDIWVNAMSSKPETTASIQLSNEETPNSGSSVLMSKGVDT